MKATAALEETNRYIFEIAGITQDNIVFPKKIDNEIKIYTKKISNEFQIDYSQKINFRTGEKEKLTRMFANYLSGKKNDFNVHYIKLLAWNIMDIKIPIKNKGIISIMEYKPTIPFAPNTLTEKTFRLFRTYAERISFALLISYLNNYDHATKRYINNLWRYLRDLKYRIIFFDSTKAVEYVDKLTAKALNITFAQKLEMLEIPKVLYNTKYFKDVFGAYLEKQ